MSGLSYICDYGSDTDESETSERESNNSTRNKLPKPKLDGVAVVEVDTHKDDPALHSGRVRSFPHVRGNWASFVHIKFGAQKFLQDLIQRIRLETDVVLEPVDDIHVSVSRTVVLKYHLITTFNASLKKALEGLSSFDLEFASIKVYCNEERSRTFVALQVCPLSGKYLLKITQKVDQVLKEFSLPEFYDDPSFHASLLWTNGDKQEQLESVLENFNIFGCEEPLSIYIDKVQSNIGNKQFQYALD